MRSRLEYIIREYCKELFPNFTPVFNIRPEWLVNPKTGLSLELDIFYHDFNLAIEVNGIGHRVDEQIEKDRVMADICAEKKISLIVVENVWQAKKICFFAYNKLIPISRRMKKMMREYKPKKTDHFHKIVKAKLWNQGIRHIQEAETGGNRIRMKAKGLL